jgi:hypothetical protein
MPRHRTLATCLALTLSIGCSSDPESAPLPSGMDASDAGPEGGTPPAPDTTAPTVLSITPADGATGVRADAIVVVKFSEPMDRLSVLDTLASSSLGAVTFDWSDGGATLTIKPVAPLAYAAGTGNDPATVEAKQYVVTLGTGAKDEAGNLVGAGAQTIFKTLKRLSSRLPRKNDLTGTATALSAVGDDDDFLQIGDTASNVAYRGFISLDLAGLPASAIEITSATLHGAQLFEGPGAYDKLGSGKGVLLDHGAFSSVGATAFALTPLSSAGEFAKESQTALTADVTAQVNDDLANRSARGNVSQYRLRFTVESNNDGTLDQVFIGRDELALDVEYLAP